MKILLLAIINLFIFTNKTKAQIVYTDIIDTNITYPNISYLGNSINYYNLDINNDSVIDYRFALNKWQIWGSPSNQPINFYSELDLLGSNQLLCLESTYSCIEVLAGCDTIDIYKNWMQSGNIYLDELVTNFSCNIPFSNKYYGVKFKINNDYHFGWVLLSVNSIGEINLKGYAYNTIPNEIILAGDTITNTVNYVLDNKEVRIYPVPFFDYLNIELNIKPIAINLKIRDLKGRIVKELLLTSNIYKLNLSDISKGVYILTLENQNNILFTKRIIKN